jgi:hypothetical protein
MLTSYVLCPPVANYEQPLHLTYQKGLDAKERAHRWSRLGPVRSNKWMDENLDEIINNGRVYRLTCQYAEE